MDFQAKRLSDSAVRKKEVYLLKYKIRKTFKVILKVSVAFLVFMVYNAVRFFMGFGGLSFGNPTELINQLIANGEGLRNVFAAFAFPTEVSLEITIAAFFALLHLKGVFYSDSYSDSLGVNTCDSRGGEVRNRTYFRAEESAPAEFVSYCGYSAKIQFLS